ncbi:MAG TPA: VTT domain-containing protein [Vicinamibacteria bacterium]|jgi:membrane-associated protein|nr:VTT domain-containing protein [Vicinamibacteria bacterium]
MTAFSYARNHRLIELIQDFFRNVYNVPEVVRTGGLLGLVLIVFAETGLMFGFFLPGDSLLVIAGVFAWRGELNLATLILCVSAAAVAGDALGYWIGYRTGKALYSRPNSLLFRREHLVKTHEFYERHGGKTIVMARFMPILRTFAPVVAGAAEMTYRQFATYNVVGGIGWVVSMTMTGYVLARSVPEEWLAKHIEIIVFVIILLSLLPAIISFLRAKLQARAARASAATSG